MVRSPDFRIKACTLILASVQQPSSPVATPVDKNDASPGPTVDPSPVLQTAIPEYPPQTPSTPIMPSCGTGILSRFQSSRLTSNAASDPITIVKQGHARNNSDPVVPPAPKISKVRDEGREHLVLHMTMTQARVLQESAHLNSPLRPSFRPY